MSELASLLQAVGALHPRRIDLSLNRIESLLDRLGRPQDRLPPVIHAAGTNGKGSTVAFLRAALEAAGRSVHVYTSPHLVRFNERIRLGRPSGGRFADDRTLIEAISEVRRVNGAEPITFFEITTAVAFHLFARHPADFCLLEVGLGGRFDATNVVATPLAAVISSVSYDHAEFLGDNLAGIALEKAGILKPGAPAVVGPQDEHALSMIATEAHKVGAPLFAHGADYMAFAERGRLVYQDEEGLLDLPLPRLAGAHQIDNAGLAVATLRRAGLGLPPQAIEAGLTGVDWPARMQRLRSGPLVALAPPGSDVWLDGGHNPSAGAAIASAFAELEERDPRPLVLIAGMLTSKDPAGFFAPFAGLARHAMTVPVPDSAAGFDPETLAEVAMAADVPARAFPDVRTALRSLANAGEKQPPRILICGSLYLAGSVLRENGPLPE
ncbi:MAG TPA: folylpolyglutamate synthase/dihydrofolate synthase family protein [Afifellaceae bacterium]|nr:folylpolyglutamate synthase/dihydrofolate synthase family protein [Afifellaceae bacterium]